MCWSCGDLTHHRAECPKRSQGSKFLYEQKKLHHLECKLDGKINTKHKAYIRNLKHEVEVPNVSTHLEFFSQYHPFHHVQKQIELEPEMSAKIVLACSGVHNYLMNRKTDMVHNLAGSEVDRSTNLIPGGLKKLQLFFSP